MGTMRTIGVALAALGCAGGLAGAPVRPAAPLELSCLAPVHRGDTLASVRARFGAAAAERQIDGAEGEQIAALVLWPDDPARRLELTLGEDAGRRITGALVRKGSRWRVAGLGLGDPLARVVAANGRGLVISGFDWDYGGYVRDLRGGRLAHLPGGCGVSLRFEPRAARYPSALSGDRALASSLPALARAKPVLDEIAIDFPDEAASERK